MKNYKEKISERQIQILKFLLESSCHQNKLQNLVGISAPGLLYHLNNLEKYDLIIKKTIQQIGNARINEISINPYQIQRIREILNLEIQNYTLITGFGELATGYKIPDISLSLLKENHYKINRIICFTTKKAELTRNEKLKQEDLVKIQKIYLYKYEDYRNLTSALYSELDEILLKEIKNANLIIDITPLSKLYSFQMLRKANKYGLPCYYIGQDKEGDPKIIWMSNIKLKGEMIN